MRKKRKKVDTKRLSIKFLLCIIYLIIITLLTVCSYRLFEQKKEITPWEEVQNVDEYTYIEISKMSEKFAYYENENIGLHFIIDEKDTGQWYTYVIAINEDKYKDFKDIIDYSYERTDKEPDKIKVYGYPSIMSKDLKEMIIKNITKFLPSNNEVTINMDNIDEYLTNSYLDTTIERKDKFNGILFLSLLLLFVMIILLIFTIFDKDKLVDNIENKVDDVETKTKRVLRLKIFKKKEKTKKKKKRKKNRGEEMKFVEITEEKYTKFWENHPCKTFLSSPKISKLREKSGWTTYYVGVKEGKKLVAAAMLFSHKRHFGVNEFYSPRGLLLDYKNEELLDYFVNELKNFVQEKKGYVLRIDPYVIYKERDIDGNIVENGTDNSSVVDNLLELGFKKVKTENKEQVGWMFSLDLEGKSEEQILKEMKPNTRNKIRKAEKIGIDVKEISYDELEEFQNIMIETGERKGFHVRSLSYFQEMYNLFNESNEVKYFITSLNLEKYVKSLEEEKKEKEEKMNALSDAKYNEGQKKNITNEIASLNKRIDEANEIINSTGKKVITLSGSMFMLIQPEVIYLSSGNYEEYMKFNSQYLIQWELIKYGIKNGFKKHNFYGIPENINEHPKDYGIYEFKRGFNGYVEELIGEFELPITYHYNLFKIIHKIKGVK